MPSTPPCQQHRTSYRAAAPHLLVPHTRVHISLPHISSIFSTIKDDIISDDEDQAVDALLSWLIDQIKICTVQAAAAADDDEEEESPLEYHRHHHHHDSLLLLQDTRDHRHHKRVEEWRRLPFHIVLHVLDHVEVVAGPEDVRTLLVGRFSADPCRVFRLLFRSIECVPDSEGLDSPGWRLVLSQVRHLSLVYYGGWHPAGWGSAGGPRLLDSFAHLHSFASRHTMPQLRTVDIDERTYSTFQTLHWSNPYLLNRVRVASMHCHRAPTSAAQVLGTFPHVRCLVVDSVEDAGQNHNHSREDGGQQQQRRRRGGGGVVMSRDIAALMRSHATLRELRAGFRSARQFEQVVQHCRHITSIVLVMDDQQQQQQQHHQQQRQDTSLSSEWFGCLGGATHIRRLHVFAMTLAPTLDKLPCCASLTDLAISDTCVESLRGLGRMPHLRRLKVSLASPNVPGVAELALCTALQTLELTSHGPVSPDLLSALCTLAASGLRSLTLDSPSQPFSVRLRTGTAGQRDTWQFGDDGVGHLLQSATRLERLLLRDHTLTPRVLVLVAQCVPLRHVVLQSISNRGMWSEALIRKVQRLGQLCTLRVSEW